MNAQQLPHRVRRLCHVLEEWRGAVVLAQQVFIETVFTVCPPAPAGRHVMEAANERGTLNVKSWREVL